MLRNLSPYTGSRFYIQRRAGEPLQRKGCTGIEQGAAVIGFATGSRFGAEVLIGTLLGAIVLFHFLKDDG